MKILKAKQVQEADRYTIDNEPILSVNLMERAATRCSELFTEYYDFRHPIYIFAGPGNNGGDGLVMARKLCEKGYEVSVFIIQFSDNFSEDFVINLERLENYPEISVKKIKQAVDIPKLRENAVLIDAVFGSGLSRPVEGMPAEVIQSMNASGCDIVAIDAPSGLQAEENPDSFTAIRATYTFTFEFPFLSFFMPENEEYVGDFKVVGIDLSEAYTEEAETDYFLLKSEDIAPLIRQRRKFSHKGTYGHGLLFAGSYGKAGAALLAAEAAYRSGAGLVSAAVPSGNYQILQTAVPEVMLLIDSREKHLGDLPNIDRFDAVAIGPGIGFHAETEALLEELLQTLRHGLILDADALTMLGKRPELLQSVPPGSILTPHPKEFERIVGPQKNHYSRLMKQKALAKELQSVIILKGAHTAVCLPDGRCYFNTTGNPGMATGGSGDVLTGMLLGLKAQGYSSEDAALLAVFMHGAAGDRAARKKDTYSMIAGDIIDNIRFLI